MTHEITYNGFNIIDTDTNNFTNYEFVNYGFIDNNYSEIIIRRYVLDTMEFCTENKYYKGHFLFKRASERYTKFKKDEYVILLDEYATYKTINKSLLNDIINMMLSLEINEYNFKTFSLELCHVTPCHYKKVNVLKKYHNSSNYLHNQFIENQLFYKSFYTSNKRSFNFIKGV